MKSSKFSSYNYLSEGRLTRPLLLRTVTWGYPTENAYYRDASSSDAVLGIRVPFLAISALDDPVGVATPKF